MPKFTFSAALDALSNLSGGWKMVGAGLAIAALAVSVGGGIKSGLQVPAKLDQHIAQQDSTIHVLRESLKEQKITNCLLAAQLRHADWTSCLLPQVP